MIFQLNHLTTFPMINNTEPDDQHPLTDGIIEEIAHSGYIDDYGCYNYVADDLRAAADWQLEQVVEWLKVNLMKHDNEDYVYLYDDCSNAYIKETELLKDLQKAMRPTNTQEDN